MSQDEKDLELFKSLLKDLKLSKLEFAKEAKISHETVYKWGKRRTKETPITKVPSWVFPFLEHYENTLKLKKLLEEDK